MPSDTMGPWTPLALSSDLPALAVQPARLAQETVALWRSASGDVTASADRCPHRGMRLSHGFVRGSALSCIYHGWRYAQTGHCLKIPAHPDLKPPETIRVTTYPVCESDGVIWAAAGTTETDQLPKPPTLQGLSPVRSITILASVSAIESICAAKTDGNGFLRPENDAMGLCLLLTSQEEGTTLAHILVADGAGALDRINASRMAEDLRRRAEALYADEGAPT